MPQRSTADAGPLTGPGPRVDPGISASVAGPDGGALLTVTRHVEGDDTGPAARVMVVTVAGQVDLATDPLLRMALLDSVQRHPSVCCDLSGVTFFGAAGVNVLVAVLELARTTGCRFALRGVHGITRRVLRVAGLDGTFGS